MTEDVRKALRWIVLLPAFLPLVVVDGLLYPYTAPKTFLLLSSAVITVAALSYCVLSGGVAYWNRLKRITSWIPGALLLVAYATSYVGIDFYHSFWSTFERGDGLLSLTAMTVLFYSVLLIAEKTDIERFLKYVAIVGSIVGLVAVLGWIQSQLGFHIPFVPSGGGRIGGTLGNAAFLAGYLGLTLFITLAAAPSFGSTVRKLIYAGAVFQLFAIVATATRGTLVALVVASFMLLCYLALRGAEDLMRKRARVILLICIAIATLFIGFRSYLVDSPFEPIARLASISVQDATVSSRLFVWSNLLKKGFENPLTGVGAEHIATLFNEVYDPGQIGEQWFDRSHNAFLDYFLHFGVLGLVMYLALILACAREAWKLVRSHDPRGKFLVLLVIVYAVQSFFVFDTAATWWVLVMVLGYLLVHGDRIPPVSVCQLPGGVSLIAALIIVSAMYPIVIKPYRANALFAEGYIYHVSEPERALAAFGKGILLGTYADLEYGYQAYEMYTERQRLLLQGSARVEVYRYARDILTSNYDKYPYDARTAVYLGHVLDTAPPEETVEDAYLGEVLLKAISLSPKRIQPWYLLANIAIKRGDKLPLGSIARTDMYKKGIAVLQHYATSVPRYAEPQYIIVTLYLAIGDKMSAHTAAEKGLATYTPNEKVARRAAGYYIAIEDWNHAERFLQDIVNAMQGDYAARYDLAKVKYLLGNPAAALEIVNTLRAENPAILETDPSFLAAIAAYESR